MMAAALAGPAASAKLPPAIIRARRDNMAVPPRRVCTEECRRKQATPQLRTSADFDRLDCAQGVLGIGPARRVRALSPIARTTIHLHAVSVEAQNFAYLFPRGVT